MQKIRRYLNNMRHTLYKVCDAAHYPMPQWAASLLRTGNGVPAPNALVVETYDGSNQAVHPSVAEFQGKLWLALTPYPYGKEFYENPSIYVRRGEKFAPLDRMAPVVQATDMGREHYSDPVLAAYEDKLTLIYRRCDRKPEGKIDQLFCMDSQDGLHWSEPTLLAEAPGNLLISPAVDAKEHRLFCVEADPAIDSKLVWYDYQSGRLGKKHTCRVNGLSDDWFVWHLDVCRSENGILRGLFMLRKKHTRKIVSKLALFHWEKDAWQWDTDVIWTPEEAAAIQFVYKSAFAGERKLLCSACDPKNRYYLFYKEI